MKHTCRSTVTATTPAPPAAAALTIRPALTTDETPLQFFLDTALRRDYFVRRGQLAEMLRSNRHTVFIAELDQVLVGVAILTRGSTLVNVLVHPACRGLGIGQALVAQSGAERVRAKLDMSSGDPRGFYRKLGFVEQRAETGKHNVALLKRSATRASRRRGTRPAAPPPPGRACA
jgi:ribosomal protein S18 acetylase RimI-like enzyme